MSIFEELEIRNATAVVLVPMRDETQNGVTTSVVLIENKRVVRRIRLFLFSRGDGSLRLGIAGILVAAQTSEARDKSTGSRSRPQVISFRVNH